MDANRGGEFMKLVFRSIIKLAHSVQPLDEYANHHQGQHGDMIGLTFHLHTALLLCVEHLSSA
jgi:hypothetical protein